MSTIDLWDYDTYDVEIREYLERHEDVIVLHRERDAEISKIEPPKDALERNHFKWPKNEHYSDYLNVRDGLTPILERKSIRAFHYSRLTDMEIDHMREEGMVPTSIEFLKQRVDRQIQAGNLTLQQGKVLLECSPLVIDDCGVREGFWMASSPFHPEDHAVNLLVGSWGGESAYWRLVDVGQHALAAHLKTIGRGRIIELRTPPLCEAAPLTAGSVTGVIVRTFERRLGYDLSPEARDIVINRPLPPDHILAIHSEGDQHYDSFGRTYPPNFKPD